MEAPHNNTIKVSVEPHGRPCWVTHRSAGSVTKHKAFLHLITTRAFVVEPSPLNGGHPGGQISHPFAVIENEFGCLMEVEIECVQLLDTDEQLKENATAWVNGGLNCTTCRHTARSYREKPCEDCNACDKWEPKA